MAARRFSVRTMLLAVLLAAVVCWWYAIGWPMWQEYRLRHFAQSIASVNSVQVRAQSGKRFSATWSKGQGIVDGGIELEFDQFKLLAERAVMWTDVNATNKRPPVEWYFEGDVKLNGVGPTEAFYAVYFDAKSSKVSVLRRQEQGQQGLSLAERAESLRRDATSSSRE